MEGVDQKTLYVGLSKSQALAIQESESAFPEESSNRFGLRESPMAALERANRFWEWHVSHHDPNMGPAPEAIASNEWMLGTMRFTAWGFMTKIDNNVLQKTPPSGEWRWEGESLQHELKLEDGRIVYILEIRTPTAADLYNPFDRPDSERPGNELPGEEPLENDRLEGDEKRQRVA